MLISWGSISEDQKLCQFKECMFYFPLKKNGFATIKGERFPFPMFSIPASPFPSFPISFRILPRTLIKADTHEGFCSSIMLQGHAPGAKLLRVYQRFHGYTSSSGAAFPPRKILHDIWKPVKYLGARSLGKLSELENAPSCVLTRAKWAWSMLREQNPLCIGLKILMTHYNQQLSTRSNWAH